MDTEDSIKETCNNQSYFEDFNDYEELNNGKN